MGATIDKNVRAAAVLNGGKSYGTGGLLLRLRWYFGDDLVRWATNTVQVRVIGALKNTLGHAGTGLGSA
jgi:hypothetical protein